MLVCVMLLKLILFSLLYKWLIYQAFDWIVENFTFFTLLYLKNICSYWLAIFFILKKKKKHNLNRITQIFYIFDIVNFILSSCQANQSQCNVVYLNCMGVRDSMDIYAKLYTEITGKTCVKKGASQRELSRKMEKFLNQSKISK